jgi:hypothetical protein
MGLHLSEYEGEDMRTLGTFLAVGILALTVGCGGSNGTGMDGGGGAAGAFGGPGGTGAGGVSNIGGSGGPGAGGSTGTTGCNYPSCLASLATTCQPSGTCVQQTDLTTYASNTCYSNGVKLISSFDLTSGAIVVTFKNASGICYTFNIASSATGSTSTYTIKNAAGQAIATGMSDGAGNTIITCTGGQPVTLNANCDSSTGASSSANCTQGVCTP